MNRYAPDLRTAKATAINNFIGPGAKLSIYSGPQPATGGLVGAAVLLATITCGTPFATVTPGLLTATSLPLTATAVATGAAAWYRVTKADGTTFVMDGTVGVGAGFDLQIATTAVTQNVQVQVAAWTITGGN